MCLLKILIRIKKKEVCKTKCPSMKVACRFIVSELLFLKMETRWNTLAYGQDRQISLKELGRVVRATVVTEADKRRNRTG